MPVATLSAVNPNVGLSNKDTGNVGLSNKDTANTGYSAKDG